MHGKFYLDDWSLHVAGILYFGKRKPRLGSESIVEECKPRLGNMTVVTMLQQFAAGVISYCLRNDKESVTPGLATNISWLELVGGNDFYFIYFWQECEPRLGNAPVVRDLISGCQHSATAS